MKLSLIAAVAAIALLPAGLAAQTSTATSSTTTRTETVEKPVIKHVVHRKHNAKKKPVHHTVVKKTDSVAPDGTASTTTEVSTPR